MLDEGRDTTPADHSLHSETAAWSWDHVQLLYRGGAKTDIRDFPMLLQRGELGPADPDRLPLVLKIRDVIDGRLRAGGSPNTAKSIFAQIRRFYDWADSAGVCLTLDNVSQRFLEWSDHLDARRRAGAIKARTAYEMAAKVAVVLDELLDREIGLIRQTRLTKHSRGRPWRRHALDVEMTFRLGHALCDIAGALTVDAIRGRLPIPILFRTGQLVKHWSGLIPEESIKALHDIAHKRNKRRVLENRRAREQDTSLRTRHPVVNLRIQAELLIFIAQTGMNLTQVSRLKAGNFSYQSHLDGYKVRRVYKGRRQGEVAFDIYSEYRPFFDRYLAWRKAFFPDDGEGLLFPLVGRVKVRNLNTPCGEFHQVRKICAAIGVPFITPSLLRKVRVNWLARRSGNLEQTAEMSQHSKQVMLRDYLRPDPDIAAVEITRFYQQSDPAHAAPGPGACSEPQADPLPDIPPQAPRPDCVSPAGCLFCSHQRDIDSVDHAWSLASYRHLKTLELATYRPPEKKDSPIHPASIVIDRLTEKINLFRDGGETRRQWIEDAIDKVKEGDYHPLWSGFIELAEALL